MNEIIFYETKEGKIRVEVRFEDETFWMTQKLMGELFGVESHTITYHLGEIFKSGELQEEATARKFRVVQKEGNRNVNRNLDFYNLDAIIAVGYRVNSRQATQFRIWATQTLKEFIIKGFVLDDERLKQGKNFGKDYFDELLARIREIRASEKRFYQKIRDLFRLSQTMTKQTKKPSSFLQLCRTNFFLPLPGTRRQKLWPTGQRQVFPIWA